MSRGISDPGEKVAYGCYQPIFSVYEYSEDPLELPPPSDYAPEREGPNPSLENWQSRRCGQAPTLRNDPVVPVAWRPSLTTMLATGKSNSIVKLRYRESGKHQIETTLPPPYSVQMA